MDNQPQEEALNQVLSDSQVFINLIDNADFTKWRDEHIVTALDTLQETILMTDRTKEGWEKQLADNVIAYQSLYKMFIQIFQIQKQYHSYAKEQIKQLTL